MRHNEALSTLGARGEVRNDLQHLARQQERWQSAIGIERLKQV